MKNFVQDGNAIDFTNETEEVIKSGDPVALNGVVGVSYTDVAPDEDGTMSIAGVYNLPKVNPEAIDKLDPVYLTDTGLITTDADDGGEPVVNYTYAGRAYESVEAATDFINVKLIPV